jgi:hypothetical protein
MKIVIYLFCCLALFSGCESIFQNQQESWPKADQLVLFKVEYHNAAWGYQHTGFFIDSAGLVRSFSLPKIWHYPDTSGYISESFMNDNLSQLDTGKYYTDKNELLEQFSKLGKISEGKLSKPVSRGADMGQTNYSGFLYDASGKRYKEITIKIWGDWVVENTAPEAEEVYRWLTTVNRKHK